MTAIAALLAFTSWTIFLVAIVGGYRVVRGLSGVRFDAWSRDARTCTDPAILKRIEHAHANCLENLPLFGAIVLAAFALNRLEAIGALATYIIYARIGQSVAHFTGTGQINILVRAGFWMVQLVCFGLMMVKILG